MILFLGKEDDDYADETWDYPALNRLICVAYETEIKKDFFRLPGAERTWKEEIEMVVEEYRMRLDQYDGIYRELFDKLRFNFRIYRAEEV